MGTTVRTGPGGNSFPPVTWFRKMTTVGSITQSNEHTAEASALKWGCSRHRCFTGISREFLQKAFSSERSHTYQPVCDGFQCWGAWFKRKYCEKKSGNLSWNQWGEKIWSLLSGLTRLPTSEILYLGTYWEFVSTRGTSRNLRSGVEDGKRKAGQWGRREEISMGIDNTNRPGWCSGQVQKRW